MDAAAQAYIDAIAPENRPLFDRVHDLVLADYPDAEVVISYQMPTFQVPTDDGGTRRLHVGAWKHGISFYGWQEGRDRGFAERHPEMSSGKGTIRLRPDDAEHIDDDELRGLIDSALVE